MVVFLIICSTLFGLIFSSFLISTYMTKKTGLSAQERVLADHRKKLYEMREGKKTAHLIAEYMDGLPAFKNNISVELKLLPDELWMQEYHSSVRLDIPKTASLPYLRILEVTCAGGERHESMGSRRCTIQDVQQKLTIRYSSVEGEEKLLLFRLSFLSNHDLFVESLKERIPMQYPTHTQL